MSASIQCVPSDHGSWSASPRNYVDQSIKLSCFVLKLLSDSQSKRQIATEPLHGGFARREDALLAFYWPELR